MTPPDFGRSVNPISTRSSRLQLHSTSWFSDVPTALPSTNSSSIVVELRRRSGWSLQATKQASQASLYRLLRAHSLTHPPHLESLSALHTELHAVWDSAHEILPALFETTIYFVTIGVSFWNTLPCCTATAAPHSGSSSTISSTTSSKLSS